MIRGFYTLMSYNCFNNAEDPENARWAPQINYFSNPNVIYDGECCLSEYAYRY